MVYRGMDKKKSRHKKFRGRSYIDDLINFLSSEDWDLVERTIQKNCSSAYGYTIGKLSMTELHRVDVDSESAGHASYRWNRVDVHTYIFHGDVPEGEFRDTLFHEVAHLIAGYGCGDRHHGKMWRKVFADLGYPGGERCHSLGRLRGTTGKPRTRTVYEYECKGCGSIWTSRRKVSAPDNWRHKGCHGTWKGYRFHKSYKEVL